MRQKRSRFLGGVLLVAGTTIGVGMLGLPVTTGFIGFVPSMVLFVICWAFMLLSGCFFIDVNCSVNGEANLISIAGKTLGAWGQILGWSVYLLLLYSLMAAYIAASAPLFASACKGLFLLTIPTWASKFFLPILFGGFIYLGTSYVDMINRLLMVALIISYIVLIIFIPQHIQINFLKYNYWTPFAYAAPVVLTSFGYHIIIPNLTNYLGRDRKILFGVIILGSIIALIVNVVWQLLVLGSVPLRGEHGLAWAWSNGLPAIEPLSFIVRNKFVLVGSYFFAFFAIITSFLGVGLSLVGFLTDGLKIKKNFSGVVFLIVLTFVPPLVFVFSYQRGFLVALEYAGAFVAILLIFLPAAMAWTLDFPKFYKSTIGRITLISAIIFSAIIVVINIMINLGFFNTTLANLLLF